MKRHTFTRLIGLCALAMLLALVAGFYYAQDPAEDLSVGLGEGCTIGVNHYSTTTHGNPVVWKVRDLDINVCQIVKYYSGENYDFVAVVHWLGEEHNFVSMGLNEAGVGVTNSMVAIPGVEPSGANLVLMHDILGRYDHMDQIRSHIKDVAADPTFVGAGCFPLIDRFGNATLFELDSQDDAYWEYDTMAPARKAQGLLGFVVRANEFHKQNGGRDDTSILWRYLNGTQNTLGMIAAGEFNEQSVVQSDSSGEYQLERFSEHPWPISNDMSMSAVAIRGVAPGEDPALATMWVLLGNPSFSFAVPTWASVSEIPLPIGTCAMYDAVTSLYTNRQIDEEWVQASVIPAESHLFDMVNNRILPQWRAAGPPAATEVTRIEERMAQDAYSVVYYLATTFTNNLAPTVDFAVIHQDDFTYNLTANADDTDGSIESYFWDFGDGTNSIQAAEVHTFPGPGIYLISLTVADDDAVTTTAWRYLTITGN